MNELFKQVRPGLFYVEYDDFDFDKAAEMTNERYRPSGPMCSGIRKGDYIGRNADVYAGFDTVLVMRLSRRCARYSSIGIVSDYFIPTLTDMLDRQEKDDTYYVLPQLVGDGINEKGVSIMMFMIPNGEASENKSNWGGREWGRSAAYTNPSAAKTYNTMLLTRLVLDNATNVDEAVELVKAVNWFDPDRFSSSGNAGSLKWLLADSRKSAVIECIDNEMKIQVTQDINRPSPCTLTTNFSLYLFSKGIIQDGASGYERYDQMFDLYSKEDDSPEGLKYRQAERRGEARFHYAEARKGLREVKRILKSVSMPEKYSRDISDKYFFATDYLWCESPSGRHFTSTELYRSDVKQDPDFIETVNLEKSRYFDKYPRPVSVTIYTTVYNLREKSVCLLYKEDVNEGRWYEFNL